MKQSLIYLLSLFAFPALASAEKSCEAHTGETRRICEEGVRKSLAENLLMGETKFACEALICLSSLKLPRPNECTEPLFHFFFKTTKILGLIPITRLRTEPEKISFLSKCPAASMASFIRAAARGADRCTADKLNGDLAVWENGNLIAIRSGMPEYCTTYVHHEYVDRTGYLAPRYVGSPDCKGYWVEAAHYDQAVVAYNAKRESCMCLCW